VVVECRNTSLAETAVFRTRWLPHITSGTNLAFDEENFVVRRMVVAINIISRNVTRANKASTVKCNVADNYTDEWSVMIVQRCIFKRFWDVWMSMNQPSHKNTIQ